VLIVLIYWVKKYHKSTEVLLGVNKEVDLEVNAEEIKYIFASRHQNA
jgi:hypothetical protein